MSADVGAHHSTRWTGRFVQKLLPMVLAGLMAGCTLTLPLNPTLDLPDTGSRLPVTIGVYYSREFEAHEDLEWMGEEEATGSYKLLRPLGEASVGIFDTAFPMLFDKVVRLGSPPPLKKDEEVVDLVIEPSFVETNFGPQNRGFGWGDEVWGEVTYAFRLSSPNGETIGSWQVHGRGESDIEFLTPKPGLIRATDGAIQDAVTKFVTGFHRVPEVKRWLRESGIRTADQ